MKNHVMVNRVMTTPNCRNLLITYSNLKAIYAVIAWNKIFLFTTFIYCWGHFYAERLTETDTWISNYIYISICSVISHLSICLTLSAAQLNCHYIKDIYDTTFYVELISYPSHCLCCICVSKKCPTRTVDFLNYRPGKYNFFTPIQQYT